MSLVGYWPLDRESGSATPDLSGNANHATFSIGGIDPGGKRGGCARAGSVAQAPYNSTLVTNNDFTLLLWMKPTTVSGRYVMFHNRFGTGGVTWQFEFGTGSGGTATLAVASPAHFDAQGVNSIITLGQWQQVGFSKSDATTQSIIVNGAPVSLATNAPVTYSEPTGGVQRQIGYSAAPTMIDEVKLFIPHISDALILAEYNKTKNQAAALLQGAY